MWRQIVIAVGLFSALVAAGVGLVPWESLTVLVSALVAGLVALSINETVRQRRAREAETQLRERRERDYELIVVHLLAAFKGGSPFSEVEVRSKISLWASNDFMQSYADWKKSIRGLGSGEVTIPDDRRSTIQEALGRVCVAARNDLGVETRDDPTYEDFSGLAMILFDDYGDRSGASRDNEGGEWQSR